MRDLIKFPFGQKEVIVRIPKSNLLQVLKMKSLKGLANEAEGIKKALQNPINTLPLNEVVKPHSKVVIVISDKTRPVPNRKIVSCILDELYNLAVRDIKILVALGMHTPNTKIELKQMLGKKILEKIKVLNHEPLNKKKIKYIGDTSRGTPVEVNTLVTNADVKIITGYIEPHEFAGFTGGRKSILPGVSGINTIKWNHRPEFFEHFKAKIGILNGNPIHEDMVEAARMVGIDFMVNVALNKRKEITKVVAGDFLEAYYNGVEFYKHYATAKVNQQADIVITSSGYPLDRDFYQSVKSIIAAELIVKKGGTIILLTESRDGIGPHLFSYWLKKASSLNDLIEKIKREDFKPEFDHCYLLARVLKKCKLIVVSSQPQLKRIKFLTVVSSIKTALNMAFRSQERCAEVIALPYATGVIPKLTRNK
ncbi:nickel-dependent lactate racemase [Candidatus Bathyarchaeota archaeon]|nr:nickel-dependent lactate racemase [Candidatus Bathyarchaeota archaeon]